MAGRPTKYRKEICDKLPKLFANGASVAEVCVELGISKDTFYKWKARHPQFADAVKEGLTLSEAWWARVGKMGTLGLGESQVNATMWIFNMKNRFHWSDRHDISVGNREDESFKESWE